MAVNVLICLFKAKGLYMNRLFSFSSAAPPMNPTIFDDRGKEVPSVAGPYEEGREMKLLCVVSGGEYS